MKPRAALEVVLILSLSFPCLPAAAQLPKQDLGGPALPDIPGPQLPKGQSPLPPPGAKSAAPLPDLAAKIRLSGPARSKAGETQEVRVEISNLAVAGKGAPPPPAGGLDAEVLLLTPEAAAAGRGAAETGVQARARLSVKRVPRRGRRETAKARVEIPAGLVTGSYLWCVEVDPAGRVAESNEGNNFACLRPAVHLAGREPAARGALGEAASRVPAAGDLGAGSVPPLPRVPAGVPGGAVAADLPVALLTLNDDPAGPVAAWRGDRVVAAWTVPAAEGDALILAMSELPIEECPRNKGVRDAIHDLERDHVTTPDTGLQAATGSLPLRLADPSYRAGVTYHVKGCVVREGRTTGRHTNFVPLRFGYAVPSGVVTATTEALLLPPDLAVHDVQVLTAPGAEGRLWITLEDRSGRFRDWYAATYERPCPAGAYCPRQEEDARARTRGETAYRFPYRILVDGALQRSGAGRRGLTPVGDASGAATGYTYLPRSGRQSIITSDYELPADGRAHTVRVELNPEGGGELIGGRSYRSAPESDYTNNALERELRRELRVRLRLGFGQFVVLADGDRRSSGELKELKVRLCREGGGCSEQARALARDHAIGRGGLIFSNPLSIDNGDTISGRFSTGPLEIDGSTEDNYFIEVYAQEDDGPCFFANCNDWATFEQHFPIPPRLRTGVPDGCGAANTFMPHAEDPRAEGFFFDYRGPDRGPEIMPSTSTICVYRTYGAAAR